MRDEPHTDGVPADDQEHSTIMASNIKTDSGVNRLLNKKYSDVTPETIREMYPTGEWQRRYSQTVYGRR